MYSLLHSLSHVPKEEFRSPSLLGLNQEGIDFWWVTCLSVSLAALWLSHQAQCQELEGLQKEMSWTMNLPLFQGEVLSPGNSSLSSHQRQSYSQVMTYFIPNLHSSLLGIPTLQIRKLRFQQSKEQALGAQEIWNCGGIRIYLERKSNPRLLLPNLSIFYWTLTLAPQSVGFLWEVPYGYWFLYWFCVGCANE